MSAFGAGGELLGSVTSQAANNQDRDLQYLAFESATPISSIEWHTIQAAAGFDLDNLWLDVRVVPEPSGFLLVMSAVAGSLLIRRRCHSDGLRRYRSPTIARVR
jgi:hypothetical protein